MEYPWGGCIGEYCHRSEKLTGNIGSPERSYFIVSTTDGAGVAAVSILDKHCDWAIRGHFSVRVFLP